MKHSSLVTRSPAGDPLDAESLAALRALIVKRGARRLSVILGPSASALERAAAGARVLRGTREMIRAGLARALVPASEIGRLAAKGAP